jgi:hypothetical protein
LARTEFLDGAAATAAVEQMAQIAKQVLEKRKETPEARQPDPFNDAVAKLVLEMAKGPHWGQQRQFSQQPSRIFPTCHRCSKRPATTTPS